jgi:3-oxoacyl-[acyl-carrier-protein] synthase-1
LTGPAAVVTGIAANTSLGDAVTTCAAVRARLARPTALDAEVWTEEEGAVPVIGYPVASVEGFQGEARLLALALEPLSRLWREAELPASPEVGLLLAVPGLPRRAASSGAVAPPPGRNLLDRLVSLAGLPPSGKWRRTFQSGHAGFASAVDAALKLLAAGEVQACIVGGVDSLCDQAALDALATTEQLKTPDNPVGLQPGEAAAFLLLERPELPRARSARVLARISGVGIASQPQTGKEEALGQGLLASIQQLLAATGPVSPSGAFFVLDRNGETARANDWGYCLQRLTRRIPGLLPATQWDPATSLGDTGAASGALGVQLAIRAFVRGYAPARCGIVVSASETGGRAALRVEQAR